MAREQLDDTEEDKGVVGGGGGWDWAVAAAGASVLVGVTGGRGDTGSCTAELLARAMVAYDMADTGRDGGSGGDCSS